MSVPIAPAPGDDLHLRLSERGSAVLPELGDPGLYLASRDAGLRLAPGDAMLGIVVLACCFAAIQAATVPGLIALFVALPALARTSLLLNRLREEGGSPHLGIWAVGLGSSIVRVAATLAIGTMAYAAGFAVGWGLVAGAWRLALGPSRPLAPVVPGLAGVLIAAFFSTPVLVLVGLRLLPVREGPRAD